jgi:hypothetical protein
VFPARADEVAECPPHYWLIQPANHQRCRKCGAERAIEAGASTPSSWSRFALAKKRAASDRPT